MIMSEQLQKKVRSGVGGGIIFSSKKKKKKNSRERHENVRKQSHDAQPPLCCL